MKPTKEVITQGVLKIVRHHVGSESIAVETNLRTEADCDSLDMVEIVMELEDEFGIEIADTTVETANTVQDLVNAVEQLKN